MPLVEISHCAIDIDLRYATPDNLTGVAIYDHAMALLHKDAHAALMCAADLASGMNLRLRVFDAFRPAAAQWKLWTAFPDPDFVANPRTGSMHSRGVAVDLTLAAQSGLPLDMGTEFDEMTHQSTHGNTEISAQAQENRRLLLELMHKAGWEHHPHEWWHYNLPQPARYPKLSAEEEARFFD